MNSVYKYKDIKFENIETYIDKLKRIIEEKSSSKTPTIIHCQKRNKTLLFFFANGYLKYLWIFDEEYKSWQRYFMDRKFISVCKIFEKIYLTDENSDIYILSF